jgi:hypothetical protein
MAQLMFAIITPALINGTIAERMKFKALLLFMVLWATFATILAHWVQGRMLRFGDPEPSSERSILPGGSAYQLRNFSPGSALMLEAHDSVGRRDPHNLTMTVTWVAPPGLMVRVQCRAWSPAAYRQRVCQTHFACRGNAVVTLWSGR